MANENSIQEEIKEIVDLCDQLKLEYKSYFNPPASKEEINEWENKNNIIIPEYYKEWLYFSNGSQILANTARFLGIKEMIVNYKQIPEDYVIIGHLVGDGEILCFSKNTGTILSYYNGKSFEYGNFKKYLKFLISTI